jgi:hypothetical protein
VAIAVKAQNGYAISGFGITPRAPCGMIKKIILALMQEQSHIHAILCLVFRLYS